MDYYVKSGQALDYANRAWSNGEKMVPAQADATSNVDTARKWVWEVTTAGTSTGTPTWPSSVTQDSTTVTQNGVVWTARRPGYSSGTTRNWAFATIYLRHAAFACAAGDRVFVSHQHNELWTVGVGENPDFVNATPANPIFVLCVNDAQVDPASMASAEGARMRNSNDILLWRSRYMRGLNFEAHEGSSSGSGSAICALADSSNNGGERLVADKCTFYIGSTSASSRMMFGYYDQNICNIAVLRDCIFRFANAGQGLGPCGVAEVQGGGLHASSAAITTLLSKTINGDGTYITFSGFDLSLAAQGVNIVAGAMDAGVGTKVVLRNCKLPTGWTGELFGTEPETDGEDLRVEMLNCSAGDENYRMWVQSLGGRGRDETGIIHQGGASDGDTPISWKLQSSSAAQYPFCSCYSPEIERRYPGTDEEILAWSAGANKTFTIEVVHDSQGSGTGGRLTTEDIWLEARNFGQNGGASFLTNRKGASGSLKFGDYFAAVSDHADSTETWNGTGGFGTARKQKLTVTLALHVKGPVHLRVHLMKPSVTVYACPKVQVS